MRKRVGRAAAALLCAALLLLSLPEALGASVYFMAVNDTLMELSADTMPATVNRTLYVPYTMLSARISGVNLGVYATYSSARNQALVYSSGKQLIFDVQGKRTYDGDGQEYQELAIMRNSVVYLPIALVCQVFEEIDYTLSSTEYGYLVRVTNRSVVLNDEAFIGAASSMMTGALERYRQEHPEQDDTPTVSPGASGSGASVYLAFLQAEGGRTAETAAALDAQGCQGLFFFSQAQLLAQDDLVRRLIGTGHLIGLRLTGQTPAERSEELSQAKDLLASAAHCRLSAVLADGLAAEEAAELRQSSGVPCWTTTVDGRQVSGSAYQRARALMRQLKTGETVRNYLLLDDLAWEELGDTLASIGKSDYQFRPPVATHLSGVSG